jgi:NADH-quinone oxidoreductase subunit A
MRDIIFNPAVSFTLVLLFLLGLSRILKKVAFRAKARAEGTGKAYACGEDIPDHLAQPDYSQFFPYAFFFTIAHVAVMIVAAVPMETVRSLSMALIYIGAVIVSLYILLRR